MKKQDLIKTVASRATAFDAYSFWHYLPNPDPVLKKMGKDISVYREILSDGFVKGCVRRRKAAVKSLEWRITETGNENIDKQLNEMIAKLKLTKLFGEILDAALFGYQALEVTWTIQNGRYIPTAVTGKPQEWFVFDDDNTLRFRSKEKPFEGEIIPPHKILLASQDATYTNPYGAADLALCFWPATFKKGGFKFWLKFVEKYGSPWVIGKHPRQATDTETDDLITSLEEMISTAVAAIPNDSSIEILESAGKSGSSEAFNEFLKFCKAEIAIALLGQNQTTEAEANRASSQAGLEVTEDIRDADASIVCEVMNELLAWICDYNYANVGELPQFELYEQETIDKVQAERDEILTKAGAKLSNQYFARIYQLEDGDLLEQGTDEQPVDFAEREQQSRPVDGLVQQAEQVLGKQTDSWIAEIKQALAQCESLEEFNAKLETLLPKLSIDEYAQILADAKNTAYMQGRYEVVESAKDRGKL
ncbi:MAG: DUF935 family protein [Gammaproteobacteria bacterium]|nr:DUF935 family protein [Gammaproteobacteria bacterium]